MTEPPRRPSAPRTCGRPRPLGFHGGEWLTAERGQGGAKVGLDIVTCERQPFMPSTLQGWCDMRRYLSLRPPAPDWPLGTWLVGAGGAKRSYHFTEYYESFEHPGNTVGDLSTHRPLGDGAVTVDGDTFSVTWARGNRTERSRYDRFDGAASIIERATGVGAGNVALKAARLRSALADASTRPLVDPSFFLSLRLMLLRPTLLLVAGLLAAAVRPSAAQVPARRPSVAAAPAAPTPPLDSARRRRLLFGPTDPYWSSRAPDTVLVDIETTRGPITVELRRAWAPHGVDRMYNLARAGYFDDTRFYRVVDGFVAQFGLAADPMIADIWRRRTLPPDARRVPNARGTVSFAQFKPDDRTTTLFINLRDNARLDALGFAPIGRVVKGMAVADRLYAGYGERPMAKANTERVYAESNAFLDAKYPKLDRIRKVTVRTR